MKEPKHHNAEVNDNSKVYYHYENDTMNMIECNNKELKLAASHSAADESNKTPIVREAAKKAMFIGTGIGAHLYVHVLEDHMKALLRDIPCVDEIRDHMYDTSLAPFGCRKGGAGCGIGAFIVALIIIDADERACEGM